jgi:hypothetical protein
MILMQIEGIIYKNVTSNGGMKANNTISNSPPACPIPGDKTFSFPLSFEREGAGGELIKVLVLAIQ